MLRMMTALCGALLCLMSAPASAQTDDPLARCLLTHTGEADRLALVKWVFTVMAASPQVESMSAVTPAERAQWSKATGAIFNRLVTVDCRAETVAAIKAHGTSALKQSFSLLGQTAMEGLMSDPAVAKSMTGILADLDLQEWAKLMIDAGMGPDGKPLGGK